MIIPICFGNKLRDQVFNRIGHSEKRGIENIAPVYDGFTDDPDTNIGLFINFVKGLFAFFG